MLSAPAEQPGASKDSLVFATCYASCQHWCSKSARKSVEKLLFRPQILMFSSLLRRRPFLAEGTDAMLILDQAVPSGAPPAKA